MSALTLLDLLRYGAFWTGLVLIGVGVWVWFVARSDRRAAEREADAPLAPVVQIHRRNGNRAA